MSDDKTDAFLEAYREGDPTLLRIRQILSGIEPVRRILRRIERESRDEDSRQQASEALQLLEVPHVAT